MSIGGQVTGSVPVKNVYNYDAARESFTNMPSMAMSVARAGPVAAPIRTSSMGQCSGGPGPAPAPVTHPWVAVAGGWPTGDTRVEIVSLDPTNHPVPECHRTKANLPKAGSFAAGAGIDGGI